VVPEREVRLARAARHDSPSHQADHDHDVLPEYPAPLGSKRHVLPPVATAIDQSQLGTVELGVMESMTSSAASTHSRDSFSPSSWATFTLIANSSSVISSTGRSPGLAPLRILSTYTAAFRPTAGNSGP